MKQNRMPYKLQFFAEAAADGAEGGTQAAADEAGTTEGARAAEDTKKEEAAAGAEQEEAPAKADAGKEDLAALVQEEIRKANMKPEEKEAYEKEQKEKALAAREDAISLRERQADAKELLANNGLPVEFRDMVLGKDKEATQANVKNFKEKFDAAVQAQVEKRLHGSTPGTGTGHTGGGEKQTLAAQVESYL